MYYGTARRESPGTGRRDENPIVGAFDVTLREVESWAAEEEWCEEAGCPRRECVGCQKREEKQC